MYCKNCGERISDEAIACPKCGAATDNFKKQRAVAPAHREDDAPNGGFAALSFFVPVAGLILYLVWGDDMPQRARSCGKGALAGFITWALLAVIAWVLCLTIIFYI